MDFWLIKSEPGSFSIDDLEKSPAKTTCWDGVRNYQARNFMRDAMKVGDQAFFYHSNCPETGIVGIVEIVSEAYPDDTALDPNDPHYDPKSDPANPRWCMVDIRFSRRLRRTISLAELKSHADGKLSGMQLLMRGNRLSVMPIEKKHWRFILSLE